MKVDGFLADPHHAILAAWISMSPPPKPHITPPGSLDPFRRAVLRGLGVLLPPLLTIVIFLWVGNTVARYVLTPLEDITRYFIVEYGSDIRPVTDFDNPPEPGSKTIETTEKIFVKTPDGLYIPAQVYNEVEEELKRSDAPPQTAREYYVRYVDQTWLQPWLVIPVFLSLFLLMLYTMGKFMAAGIGRFFWGQFEALITRLPLVSNVYTSVKQVTDFLFTEPDFDITRIVAVEYPRKGIWTVAFVTGESLLDIESAANEAVLSVLIPTSPMPFTGFTITVRKSETIDLNMTIDQAFQFVVSCGVVVPENQIPQSAKENSTIEGSAVIPQVAESDSNQNTAAEPPAAEATE